MAGDSYSIKVEGQERIIEEFNRLIKQSNDLTPVFRDIGEYLIESTQQRFVEQKSPDGEAWQPLSELSLSRKTRKDKILTESGTLADTLTYQISGDELLFGSNLEYAAMHQFGGITSPKSMFPNKEIPARPFLGISDEDEEEILALITEHILN